MNQLNSVLLEGNLTKDPQMKETPRGTQLCTFSMASNRFMKHGDEYEKETSFFDVETWSALATACGKNLRKGRGVRVVGRLKQDRWTAPDGSLRTAVRVVAEHVEFKPELKEKAESGDEEGGGEEEIAKALAQPQAAGRETLVF